jgi:hypothetical protein
LFSLPVQFEKLLNRLRHVILQDDPSKRVKQASGLI